MMRQWKGMAAGLALAGLSMTAQGAGRDEVVTFSTADLERVMAEGCALQTKPEKITAHRNATGELLYIVAAATAELIIMPEQQQCNPISDRVSDLWRSQAGEAVAQLTTDDIKPLMLVGDSEIRGNTFDVDRSGQYVLASFGERCSISPVNRPYRTLATLPINGQRIFSRKRAIMVVGENKQTGGMEARMLAPTETGLAEQETVPLQNIKAGVKVLDYNEGSDELLLSGVDSTGRMLFVVYDLQSGQAATVPPSKPGDDQGLFVKNARLRARLGGGGGAPASSLAPRPGIFR